jgi:hypothetical protein
MGATEIVRGRDWRRWLFNPFYYIAGWQALVLGLIAMFAASFIGALSRSHFDGVLDFHTGAATPLWVYPVENLINWLSLATPLMLAGRLISTSRPRAIDVFGTQALARFPTVLTALAALLPGYQRQVSRFMLLDMTIHPADAIMFGITALVVLIAIVWMVALMYRGFAVSCNVRGGGAIGVFIVSLLVAEAVSKFLLVLLFEHVVDLSQVQVLPMGG